MASVIAVGTWAGIKLDEKYPSETPIYTLMFSLCSVIIGIYIAIKDLIKK